MFLFVPFVLLANAHAHNDYAHPRPLFDALDQGFLSVEADVFLVDGELRVGHDRKELRPGRTLESLYLDPLAVRIRRNRGHVYASPGTLTLLIDLKEPGERLEPELLRHLANYRRFLSARTGATVQTRAVQVVLSGARTEGCAAADGPFFKDGKVENFGDDPARTPWISGEYGALLGEDGAPLSRTGHAKLVDLVARAHVAGKRLRFWGGPDTEPAWRELGEAGVDLLNTDRLADLRTFLLARR